MLRKDFIVDRGQVWEAAEAGAAAVLLIVGILSDDRLHELLIECLDCGLDPLVEVHDLDETRRACSAGCTLVGINNRDLVTLEVDIATTEYLAPALGPCMFPVSESGISTPADACRAASSGARALLVGETLVRTPAEDLPALIAQPQRPGVAGVTRVKVCGLTRAEDVRLAAELGAWALGFVLTESPRRIDPGARSPADRRGRRRRRLTVGVVTTEPPGWIAGAVARPVSAPCSSPPARTARRSRRCGPRPRACGGGRSSSPPPTRRTRATPTSSCWTPGPPAPTAAPAAGWTGRSWPPTRPRRETTSSSPAACVPPTSARLSRRCARPRVDVSSGVEGCPGSRTHGLLREFFAAVEHADREAEAAGGGRRAAAMRRTTG